MLSRVRLRRLADPLLQFGERHLAAVQRQDLIDRQVQPFDVVVQIHAGRTGLRRRRGVGRGRRINVDFDQQSFLRQVCHDQPISVRIALDPVEFHDVRHIGYTARSSLCGRNVR
jgi:hypothetical protein